jgi:hypothetical protein
MKCKVINLQEYKESKKYDLIYRIKKFFKKLFK